PSSWTCRSFRSWRRKVSSPAYTVANDAAGNPREVSACIYGTLNQMPWPIFLLAVSLFTFLGGAARAQDKKLEPLAVSYASVTGSRTPLWVAREMGLFEKYALDIKLINISSGSTSMQALLGGDIQLVAASGTSAVATAAQGAPVVIVASSGPIAYKLIAHPSITSVQGLKGKIIGSSRAGAGTDFALRQLLPKLGLTPGKDITILPTGLSESDRRLMLIMQGRIDATIGLADNVLQLELRGQKLSVLADVLESGVWTSGSDIITTRAFLKSQRRRIKAFLMAFSEAIWLAKTRRELAYNTFRKYMKIENPRILEATYQTYVLGTIPDKPYPREESIQSDIDFLSAANPEFKKKKPSDFIDTTLLREMESEGFFNRFPAALEGSPRK
ncbi:MAG: ABC transporter substrate-binding protein, partial [Candidatus Binatia bacterium]